MVTLIIGLLVVAGLVATKGLAAAQNWPSQANLTGYTKDQCKDGGRRELGLSNQGQCVSYSYRATNLPVN